MILHFQQSGILRCANKGPLWEADTTVMMMLNTSEGADCTQKPQTLPLSPFLTLNLLFTAETECLINNIKHCYLKGLICT